MKQLDSHHQKVALGVLAKSRDLTLASLRSDGTPHATTVSFASEGLVIYAAIGIDSQKAHNIRHDGRVALAVNAPYQNWNEIQGLSIEGVAEIITEHDQVRRASELLLSRFAQYAKVLNDVDTIPWPGMLYIRIVPRHVAVLDYTESFGHTTHFTL